MILHGRNQTRISRLYVVNERILKILMKHLFIINPVAGKGKALELIPQIKKMFTGINDGYFIEVTQYPGHATEIVRSYVSNDAYRVYSIGGDGTLNEVLNGIVGSNSCIAVIPSGSGNDFFRSICSNNEYKNVLWKTVNGKEKLIDIAKVNGQYFLNISSVGFDAETSYNTQLTKRIPFISGSIAYKIAVLITVIRNKNYLVNISYDGKKFSGKILLTAIANGRYYGGGILPAPEAKLDDGMLDICIVIALGRFKILRLFPRYIKGTHIHMEEVHISTAKKIDISCEKEMPLNIDGEVKLVKHAAFEIIPKGIKILIPN
jgi:YegS/Rv2252/BmrU family lipid kinase